MKCRSCKKVDSKGFTIIELMVVLAIIAIASALAIPQMGPMIQNYYLRSATLSLVSELQSLKLTALKENEEAKMMILQEDGVYKTRSFVDFNDDNTIDPGEQIKEKVMDDSVSIVVESGFSLSVVGFTNRGMPSNGAGTISLRIPDGKIKLLVVINLVGNIRTRSEATP